MRIGLTKVIRLFNCHKLDNSKKINPAASCFATGYFAHCIAERSHHQCLKGYRHQDIAHDAPERGSRDNALCFGLITRTGRPANLLLRISGKSTLVRDIFTGRPANLLLQISVAVKLSNNEMRRCHANLLLQICVAVEAGTVIGDEFLAFFVGDATFLHGLADP